MFVGVKSWVEREVARVAGVVAMKAMIPAGVTPMCAKGVMERVPKVGVWIRGVV